MTLELDGRVANSSPTPTEARLVCGGIEHERSKISQTDLVELSRVRIQTGFVPECVPPDERTVRFDYRGHSAAGDIATHTANVKGYAAAREVGLRPAQEL